MSQISGATSAMAAVYVGFDPKTFSGPFLTFASFAQYLLPLAALELYFRAHDSGRPLPRSVMAAALTALTLMTATGVIAASLALWLPRI